MHAFLTQKSKVPVKAGSGSAGKSQNSMDTLEINPDTSIGIEEVRHIHHFLSRKPIQSDRNIVVIHQAHLLTLPAQNALLKTLEEPPGNSLIYLVTDYPDQLLPTVLSRVQIENRAKSIEFREKDLEKTKKILEALLAAKVGERLKLLEDQAFTRDTALQFLDQLEHIIHHNLALAPLYPLIPETRKFLKANCNLKLVISYLALKL